MASTARDHLQLPSAGAVARARPLGARGRVLPLITAGCVSPGAAGTTVQVTWRTLDERYPAGADNVRLRVDGTFAPEAHIGPSWPQSSPRPSPGSIIAIAYRTELDAMREHLVTANSEFRVGLPPGYMPLRHRTHRETRPAVR